MTLSSDTPAPATIDAPGPSEPFDVNVDRTTFDKLGEWVAQYGSVVAIAPLKRRDPAVLLNNPEHVKHVLIGNHRNYTKGVGFERVAMLLGNGIIVSDGDFWRSQRRMIQPAFHKNIVKNLAEMMQRCNERKLQQWQEKAGTATPIDLTEEMSELALEVILRALFSDDLDRLIEELGSNPFSMLVQDVTRDLKLAMRFRALTRHVSTIINWRRQQHRIEHDFLSFLLETRDKDTGAPMSDKALIDEVMTIIVAGHETTAGTLNWAWYLISQHQDVEAKLHGEVDALQASPQFADLDSLRYTRCLIDETLRLYPPVWLYSRKALACDELVVADRCLTIPAGSDVFLCPYLLHRDPLHWPEPDRFDPERFNEENSRQRNRHVYYPFSLGSRRCIGEFFSLVDMQLHIGLLARHIKLQHVPGERVEIEPLINLRSRNSIMMLPVLRPQ